MAGPAAVIAEGRTAEIVALDDDRVVKLDRPGFDGLSTYEADVLVRLHVAGLPVPAMHGTTVIDGRAGAILQHLHGPSLTEVIRASQEVEALAGSFVDLHLQLGSVPVEGMPDLAARLRDEVGRSGLDTAVRDDLGAVIDRTDGPVGLCHFDLHPDNVIVTDDGWVVVDWLTVATGPVVADVARSLLLWERTTEPAIAEFMGHVRRLSLERRGFDESLLGEWRRVVAAARLAEGFDGDYADGLRRVAEGG